MGIVKKKICFVTTTSITLKTFVVDTAIMLHDELNMDVTFICTDDDKFAASLPEYIKYIPVSMKRGIDLSGIKSLRQLVKVFKNENFDLVQYSTPNAALYASWAAKIAKIPVRLYAQWGIRYVGFSGVKRSIFKFIEKFTCKKSTHIRAVSPMNLEFAVSEGLYPKEKAKVLGIGGTIGVDLSEYPLDKKEEWRSLVHQKHNISDGFVFGFAGRLSRDKGGNELLASVKRLVEKGKNITLLIVGPNESEGDINDDLMRWMSESNCVVATGLVPKTDMPMYYAAMDTLVHPTYREGFGMVLQEAAAMACPIITTKIPGASEVMENGVSCILTEPRDAESLYECMKKLIEDTELKIKLGSAARQRVVTYFERKIMLSNQKEDYIELVGDK